MENGRGKDERGWDYLISVRYEKLSKHSIIYFNWILQISLIKLHYFPSSKITPIQAHKIV